MLQKRDQGQSESRTHQTSKMKFFCTTESIVLNVSQGFENNEGLFETFTVIFEVLRTITFGFKYFFCKIRKIISYYEKWKKYLNEYLTIAHICYNFMKSFIQYCCFQQYNLFYTCESLRRLFKNEIRNVSS